MVEESKLLDQWRVPIEVFTKCVRTIFLACVGRDVSTWVVVVVVVVVVIVVGVIVVVLALALSLAFALTLVLAHLHTSTLAYFHTCPHALVLPSDGQHSCSMSSATNLTT